MPALAVAAMKIVPVAFEMVQLPPFMRSPVPMRVAASLRQLTGLLPPREGCSLPTQRTLVGGTTRSKTSSSGIVLFSIALAACDAPPAASVEPAAYPTGMQGRPIAVRTSSGGEERKAMLVEPLRTVSLSELATAIREAGYGCESIRVFDQLEFDGKRLDIHKVDCLEYSYQVTLGNGRSDIERWTGLIAGT